MNKQCNEMTEIPWLQGISSQTRTNSTPFLTRNNYYNERLRNVRIVATRGYLKSKLIFFLYLLKCNETIK